MPRRQIIPHRYTWRLGDIPVSRVILDPVRLTILTIKHFPSIPLNPCRPPQAKLSADRKPTQCDGGCVGRCHQWTACSFTGDTQRCRELIHRLVWLTAGPGAQHLVLWETGFCLGVLWSVFPCDLFTIWLDKPSPQDKHFCSKVRRFLAPNDLPQDAGGA